MKEWRRLRSGECIQRGDEYFDAPESAWHPFINPKNIGACYLEGIWPVVRRAVLTQRIAKNRFKVSGEFPTSTTQ